MPTAHQGIMISLIILSQTGTLCGKGKKVLFIMTGNHELAQQSKVLCLNASFVS